MREIKFRAWDKFYKHFHEGDIIRDYILGEFVDDPDYEVSQYTGLKDMNGVEIFESDIIRRDFEVGHEVIDPVSLGVMDYEISESGYFIGVVSYRPTEGYVLNKCRKYNEDGELQAKKSGVKIYSQYAKIIGNIFENPELLEEK